MKKSSDIFKVNSLFASTFKFKNSLKGRPCRPCDCELRGLFLLDVEDGLLTLICFGLGSATGFFISLSEKIIGNTCKYSR